MTFVGKVFIVLQLVLSICFMAWAGAVYTAEANWREQAQNLEEQKEQVESALAEAEASLQKQKSESAEKIEELEDEKTLLTSRLSTKSDQLANAESALEEARTSVDQQTALTGIAQEQSDFRKEEAISQRARNDRLQSQINDLLTQIRELEDTVYAKDQRIASMKERQQQVIADMTDYRSILLSQGMSLDPADYEGLAGAQAPPPKVAGRVLDTQVSSTTGTEFVAVSLGSDDGFSKGDELSVSRGGEYLGRVKLTDIKADESVGMLIPRTRPRNGAIQKGDNVHP